MYDQKAIFIKVQTKNSVAAISNQKALSIATTAIKTVIDNKNVDRVITLILHEVTKIYETKQLFDKKISTQGGYLLFDGCKGYFFIVM